MLLQRRAYFRPAFSTLDCLNLYEALGRFQAWQILHSTSYTISTTMVEINIVPFAFCILSLFASATHAIVHPGLLHNTTNINLLKAKSESSTATWSAAYAEFSADSYSSASYVLKGPLAVANASKDASEIHYWGYDGKAAYQNALMVRVFSAALQGLCEPPEEYVFKSSPQYHITADKAHATKAMEVLDRWAATLKSIIGTDAVLRAAICNSALSVSLSPAECARRQFAVSRGGRAYSLQ